MDWSLDFFLMAIGLGISLAMDAFSVSLANGLNDPCMKPARMCGIAGMFAFFQALMPMIGWFCVHSVADAFQAFETFIPWIAFLLLSWIGGKMLIEGIRCIRQCEDGDACACGKPLTLGALVLQGVATSIDALSVGFTISDYTPAMALASAGIIAFLTFFICAAGLYIGKKFGTRISKFASILGGSILLVIGVWILVKSFLPG